MQIAIEDKKCELQGFALALLMSMNRYHIKNYLEIAAYLYASTEESPNL